MPINRGFGGGGLLGGGINDDDDLVLLLHELLPAASTIRRTTLYFPISKTFVPDLAIEEEEVEEDMTVMLRAQNFLFAKALG